MKEKYLLVYCTCPDEAVAASMARTLVQEGLAACVNRVPHIHSTYSWKGRIEDDPEVLMLIKTSARHLARLSDRIEALHPYEVPEVVAVEICEGSERYLAWLGQSLSEPERDG